LSERKLLPELQSAYRAYHSTETAVLRVLSDIFEALDRGDWATLTLLDLSAAFDTIDHTTLIRRLQISYGFNDVVLSWFLSYLHDRSQYVRCSNNLLIYIMTYICLSTTVYGVLKPPITHSSQV